MKYSGCMKIMYFKGAKMYFFKFQNLPFSSSFFTKFFPPKESLPISSMGSFI